jgi:hypothetical protein
MTGSLDANCKGFVAAPTNEICVETRLSWLPKFEGITQTEGTGQTWTSPADLAMVDKGKE